MLNNPFALIIEPIQEKGLFPATTVFEANSSGKWFFLLRVGKMMRKVEYFGQERLLRISERERWRFWGYRVVGVFLLEEPEHVEPAVAAILAGVSSDNPSSSQGTRY